MGRAAPLPRWCGPSQLNASPPPGASSRVPLPLAWAELPWPTIDLRTTQSRWPGRSSPRQATVVLGTAPPGAESNAVIVEVNGGITGMNTDVDKSLPNLEY